MTIHRSTVDPYRSDRRLYECHRCTSRVRTESHVESCPDCGGEVRNIAVARE